MTMTRISSTTAASGSACLGIEIRRLHKSFGGVRAVWDVSFTVPAGKTVGLIGPNGSGKTTLLNLLAGYYKPDAGEILYRGTDLAGLAPERIARAGVIRTWQDPRIVPDLTVAENIAIGALARGAAMPNDAARRELLAESGLSAVANTPAGSLPYGQQKLVAIARSLAASPAVLLLDEPLAGLSAFERQHVVGLIERFRATGTVLLVDHAFGVIAQLCDHVVVLNTGTKLTEGPPTVISKDPSVIEVYFG
jgi:ABC-type branched-subunit amino acid transport system ATPase component